MFPPMKSIDLQVFISVTPISHFPIDILRPDFRVKNCLQTIIKTLKISCACSQILHVLETCVVHYICLKSSCVNLLQAKIREAKEEAKNCT